MTGLSCVVGSLVTADMSMLRTAWPAWPAPGHGDAFRPRSRGLPSPTCRMNLTPTLLREKPSEERAKNQKK